MDFCFCFRLLRTPLRLSKPWGPVQLNYIIDKLILMKKDNVIIIQVCSDEGDWPSPRRGNSKRVKIHWKSLKIFSRTSGPKSIKLGTYHTWVKGIQVCSNKGPGPLQMGDNRKNVKMGWGHLKILFLRTMKPEKLNFTWKLFSI
jgi:hypothetical protein